MSADTSTPDGGWSKITSPYHPGEQLVQERAGAREFAERMGRRVIRDHMTQQHREFYAKLPFIFIGSLDAAKRPWASIMWGPQGFTSSSDHRRLEVRGRSAEGDPLRENLRAGAPVALVGVQFETRRRNRLTGLVQQVSDDRFDLAVSQSFGNCPQYIQAREPRQVEDLQARVSPQGIPVSESPLLSDRAQALIRRSDTFFIASASPHAGAGDPVEGADINHRGGRPGFLRVTTEDQRSVITWPDFSGNSAFNTLGNIALNPVAGLLFVDFDNGDVLSITGQAVVLWDDDPIQRPRGAERTVQMTVDEGVYITGALPLRWGPPDYATQLARTGVWSEGPRARSETPVSR